MSMQRFQRPMLATIPSAIRAFFSCIIVVAVTVSIEACTNDPGTASTTPPGTSGSECVDGATQDCTCKIGGNGSQICSNGSFGACFCMTGCKPNAPCGLDSCHLDGPPTCGDGVVSGSEECDDGNCDQTDGCKNDCTWPYCGDGIIQPPEMCDGNQGCPADCGAFPPGCTPCKFGMFVDFVAKEQGAYLGETGFGIEEANLACQALGGARMCNYADWKKLDTTPGAYPSDRYKLASKIPAGVCASVWLNRTQDLVDCPAGAGSRCGDWSANSDDFFDGEWVEICNNDGMMQYSFKLDCDPIVDMTDPMTHNAAGLECSAHRLYPCCNDCPP